MYEQTLRHDADRADISVVECVQSLARCNPDAGRAVGAARDAPAPRLRRSRSRRPSNSIGTSGRSSRTSASNATDPATQMATLRFDLEDGAKHALSGGRFAIVPGDPANSQMITARSPRPNPAVRMPRSQGGAAAGEPLTERQIALLTRWIEQGATWQKHWSFIPPKRPAAADGAEGCRSGCGIRSMRSCCSGWSAKG